MLAPLKGGEIRNRTEMPVCVTSGSHSVNMFTLTFLWTAVLGAGGEVFETIGVSLAATIDERLTLHGVLVEEVKREVCPAGSRDTGKAAGFRNLWGGERKDLRLKQMSS